jgi:hypothetical protein
VRFLCGVATQETPHDEGSGGGGIYLVVPPVAWSRANEIIENLDV